MSVDKSQKKPAEDWHRADVVAALHKKGWSLRRLSKESGLSAGTLKSALDRSYPKAERIIAAAIEIDPRVIWPNRYAKRDFTPVLSPAFRSLSTQSTSEHSALAAA